MIKNAHITALGSIRQIAVRMLLSAFLLSAGFGRLHAQMLNIDLLQNKPSAEIPFRSVNNLILIPVLLDNLIPLEFLLDTGVRTPILTDRVYSDVLNINYDRVLSLKGAGEANDVHAYVASNVKMLLPNVQVTNQPMLVLEEDYLNLGSQLGVPVHGIIGYELFARFVVKIDYDRNVLVLYEPEKFKAPRGYTRLDLTIENAKPYLQAEIIDQTGKSHILKFLIDTGASHALLLHSHTDKENVPQPDKVIYGNLGRGLLGDIKGNIGRIPQFNLAGRSFMNVLTSFPENSSYDITSQDSDRDGTLGGELLSRFNVIIDYPHKAIYLQKAQSCNRPFIFNKTGITVIAQGAKLQFLEVIDVRKGSPADEAGIRKYDILYKVNGMSASGSEMNGIGNMLRKRDGKKVRFVLLRGGEKVKIQLRLKDII